MHSTCFFNYVPVLTLVQFYEKLPITHQSISVHYLFLKINSHNANISSSMAYKFI